LNGEGLGAGTDHDKEARLLCVTHDVLAGGGGRELVHHLFGELG
jgi:hypothetical protein